MKESIRCDLENYIVNNILPQYRNFDKAHGQEHIEQVIAKSLFLAGKTGGDREMAYVIAAYHDIGMRVSREDHGFQSAIILKTDVYLPKWFDRQDITIMAQAVEDHSTSLGKEPRSLYGKIIYQADKSLDAETVIRRAVQFGAVHYKHYSFEEQVDRVYQYTNKKYGKNGLMKFWLDIPEEHSRLQRLRKKIKDREYVSNVCRKNY